MGASSIETFDDDENADWLGELLEQDAPLAFLTECLNRSQMEVEYMEYPVCSQVLCSSVMIDAILHGPTEDVPPEAVEWIESNKGLIVQPLVPAAIDGLNRLTQDGSELHELWQESEGHYSLWIDQIQALKSRLEQALKDKR